MPEAFAEHPAIATVVEAIHLLRREVGGEVAIIGKVCGPWSLAYHTFGLAPFLKATIRDPGKVAEILHRLKAVPLLFARLQIEAPLILHCCGKTLDRIAHFNDRGMACFHFESANDPQEMRGSREDVRREVFAALEAGVDIVAPECAIPLDARLENVIAVKQSVDEYYDLQ